MCYEWGFARVDNAVQFEILFVHFVELKYEIKNGHEKLGKLSKERKLEEIQIEYVLYFYLTDNLMNETHLSIRLQSHYH